MEGSIGGRVLDVNSVIDSMVPLWYYADTEEGKQWLIPSA